MAEDTQRHNNKKPNDQQRLSQQAHGEASLEQQVYANQAQPVASVQRKKLQ